MKKIVILSMLLIIGNSFSFFGGGKGAGDYWQMKTYFENVSINAKSLKSLNAQLNEIQRQIELSKKLPDQYLIKQISEYDDTIKTLVSITNSTKSVLRDAKKAELWFQDVYKDVQNRQYMDLLDKFTNTLDNLAYDAMKTNSMNEASIKMTSKNAQTLIRKTREAKNPQQILEVLSQWSSNLSIQMNTLSEMIASDNRLNALKSAEEAQVRIEEKKNSDYTKKSLQKHIEELNKEVKKNKRR